MNKKSVVLYNKEPELKKIAPSQGSELASTPSKNTDNAHKKATRELDNLATGSARVILDIKAVFPFNFFPDEVIVDETKVSVHTNYFFYNKEVRSIEYGDIFNVSVQQGIIFAKIEIVDRYFSEQSITVEYLKKSDAVLARRIIQGMIIAKKRNINLQTIPINDLLQKLSRIGQTR